MLFRSRNDLSDADLELVQVAPRLVDVAAPEVAQAPEPVAADGAAWNKIKNQFFGASKA